MTTTDRITTLARRYCLDNFKYWAEKYSNEKSGNNNPYSDEDYDTFPRYLALNAILENVETVVGKAFNTSDKCRSELKNLALSSETTFTNRKGGPGSTIAIKAIQEEKQKFTSFIDQLTPDQIKNVEPLPFRRKLLKIEANKIRESLKTNWNFDGSYWEPLNKCSTKPFIFFDKSNLSNHDFEKIKNIITDRAEDKIYEITEEHRDYKVDKSEFDPNCYETVYTDKSFNWIIYGSHEQTIAFGGEWLLTEIEKQLSDKKTFINVW